jgi:phosphatidylglycerol:prolipoprotein diacylglycerol transferase
LEVRYYGVLFALGFVAGYFILRRLAPERSLKPEIVDDYLVWLIPSVVVGARLFEVLVYEPGYYLTNPAKIIAVWEGGLASHGGAIGGILATLWFCRRRKIPFYDLADLAVIPAALGAAFVRLGNFFNSELVGRTSDVPWAMEFPGHGGRRHPSQLYEAAKNIILFAALWHVRKIKELPRGFLFWSFVGGYSVLRFIVEFWKDWPLHYGLTQGQWLSMPLIILAGAMLVSLHRREKKVKRR